MIQKYAEKHKDINPHSVIRLHDFLQNKWLENVLNIENYTEESFIENAMEYTQVVASITDYLEIRGIGNSTVNRQTLVKEIEFLSDLKYAIKNKKATQGIFLPLARRYIRSRKESNDI